MDTLESYTGCDSIRILELREDSEYIPNVFSPNGDGINDHFIIFQNSRQASELQYFALFDMFGDMVYETRSWPVQWDGNNRTQTPYQSAVFAYVFIYSCGDNTIIKNGNVTLVR